MNTHIGDLQCNYSIRGRLSYSIELSHQGLKKHRLIRGPTSAFVKSKTSLQAKEWNEKWDKMERCWDGEGTAKFRTEEAKKEFDKLESILHQALTHDLDIFELLKDTTPFPEPKPVRLPAPFMPSPKKIPKEPIKTELLQFNPILDSILMRLIPYLKRKAIANYKKKAANHAAKFQDDYVKWQNEKLAIEKENSIRENDHKYYTDKITGDYKNRLKEWECKRAAFIKNQKTCNDLIDSFRKAYFEFNTESVNEFFSTVLELSEYPAWISKEFRVDYLSEIKTLVIDYSLPNPEAIPTLKEVRYVKARGEFTERRLSQTEHSKLYDDVLYRIALRSIYEVLKSDTAEALEAVIFNGWVRSIDRSTGKEINPCIISLHCKRDEFMAINLANIEPKLCFKFLKGVGSSKLFNLAGIAPILQIPKNDPRFSPSYGVVDTLDDSYNLATMDWEDFEHLIRELFEKEFSQGGCEVKVTRASRDGGVDAIIFNPDPIHGGKIVIQAKRYNNPVGVSAVRDLYGTVLNEGANKGILVTTSDFGPDSYSFANGKPLTLFNGGNLLHLLAKHGHKAKIDLQDAKQ